MWTTPELAPPLLTTTPRQREDVSALDRFNVHRCPTRRVFSGTGLEPVTKQATVRYLYHSATAATLESEVECLVYADNIFIFCSHKSLDVICKKIQNTLERISQWCKYWKLNLSPEKCTIAELSNKRNYTVPNILLAGFPLQ
ncbi:uncharacterized protein TNCV_2393451 [Trichonephila clavipes]|nr:uncharacterized protein TNCV_2393451 [Trichonephila clavipes]